MNQPADPAIERRGFVVRFLDVVEKVGNRLPDPAMLFLLALVVVWILSALLAGTHEGTIDPRSGEALIVNNLLTGEALAQFLAGMVRTFTSFAPLGVVLVAMLGVGVAEKSGFINAGLKIMLGVTPKSLLTPSVILIAIISHTATDAGYVLVIPLAGVIFHAMGRHPLAGIAAAFAGVSGGFSANFVPSAIDPLLQGFTQSAAQIIDPEILLNPLNNWFFTASSCFVIIALGWFITDRIIEPKLASTEIDGDKEQLPTFDELGPREHKAFWLSTAVMIIGLVGLFLAVLPQDSALRAQPSGEIAVFTAPLMQSIVPLIFLIFVIPGTIYGYAAGTFRKSKDVVDAMSVTMESMAYYIVMAFFCALFIDAFARSNMGAMLAIEGAEILQALALPAYVTIIGIIFLTAFVNLAVGSASAKWALLAPIFVPMLMQLGISPDLTQAAYRVGDSSSNIVTPLMPYFPLVVVFCQRYVKGTGIGTLLALMIPYSIAFLVAWSAFLVVYWLLGIPLGLQASYVYP